MTHRPPWPEYFIGIAQAVSARGECTRSQVGAVIVRRNRILATGYNGVAAGHRSCLDGACPRAANDVPRGSAYTGAGACIALHAEANAVLDAARRGISVVGSTIYVTKRPCEACSDLVERCGMEAVW